MISQGRLITHVALEAHHQVPAAGTALIAPLKTCRDSEGTINMVKQCKNASLGRAGEGTGLLQWLSHVARWSFWFVCFNLPKALL